MKKTKEVVACVVDFSMFMPVAVKLAQQVGKVYYTTPVEKGFQEIGDFVFGEGVDNIHRIDDYENPEIFDEIDLFVFPYILYSGKQLLYEKLGKAVWGARKADELEIYKGRFYDMLQRVGLPVPNHEVIRGMTNLRIYLKENDDVYVKMSRFRGTMDTWHHVTYQKSQSFLDLLTCELGPFQDRKVFYVLENIDTPIEGGIDTYCIDGNWPEEAVLGYEKKDECYLATVKPLADMPKEFNVVNGMVAPELAKYRYRQFFSTEVRVKGGKSYFIDPTCRTASPAGEEMLDLFGNIGDIMWHGAHGELVEPEITARFAGEAYMHWRGGLDEWRCVTVPTGLPADVKFYGCAKVDDAYWRPPEESDIIGCIVSIADDAKTVIDNIKETAGALEDSKVSVDVRSFADLLEEIESAGKHGIDFTNNKMPTAESVL
jgi:hypothetical protein